MQRLQRGKGKGEQGFSLVEMIIASAIFAIAAAVAFILYNAAQKSFKAGQNFTDQQQNTRVAFERVLSDLRNAGYNYNPDGSKSRPDEQIEAAFDNAIVLRADLDFEDATLKDAPESNIKGVFNAVSTGNDEIVAYVLGKPGWTGGSTMAFTADIDNPTRSTITYQGNNISVGPRDAILENVRMGNVALVQNSPPYTLYRVTLNNDLANYSSGANPTAAAFFTRQPVADNIRTMTFKYYDDSGTQIGTFTPTDASDDIGGADAGAPQRARIRRVAVDLVGMTPNPDQSYLDPAEASTSSTAHYRKFQVSSNVTIENMGRSGMQDSDNTPPGQVTPAPTLCGGHCQGVLVNFVGRPASELVSSYNVGYGSTSAATPYVVNTPYPHFDNGVPSYTTHAFIRDTAHFAQASSWYFKVQGKDSSGNVGAFSTSASSGALTDTTVPSAPGSGWATERGSATHPPLDAQIQVHFGAVTTNASGPTGCVDADAPMIRDLKGYRAWRGVTSGFTPGGTPYVDETVLTSADVQFTDSSVAQCQTYFYKVAAVDLCGNQGGVSPAIGGSSETTVEPMAPYTVAASRTSQNDVTITWPAVVQDVQSRTILVASYEVVYAMGTTSSDPNLLTYTTVPGSPVSGGSLTLVHNLTTTEKSYLQVQDNTFFYKVRAADACPNFSAYSYPSSLTCTFNGNPIMSPASGANVAGSVPIGLVISGGGDIYVRARIFIPNPQGGAPFYDQTATAYPFVFPNWNSAAVPAGTYTVYIEVENSNGCVNYRTQTLTVSSVLACQISPANPNLSPTTGTTGGIKKSDLTWEIINNAGKDLFIDRVDVSWTNTLGFDPKLNWFAYPAGINPPSYTWTVPPVSPTTTGTFSLPLFFDRFNDMTSPVSVKLDFTNSLVNSSGNSGEVITIRFVFHDSSSVAGSCTFQVIAKDLSVTTQ
jgi:prepilin-type N-terminal cleavage/methylation domain-containing protein